MSAEMPTTAAEATATEVLATRVTVKFRLDDTYAVAQQYDSSITIAEMVHELSTKFQLCAKYMQLWHCDICFCQDDTKTRLSDVPQNEFSICEFDLSLNERALRHNEKAPCDEKPLALDLEVFYQQYHMPEFIVVNIMAEPPPSVDGVDENDDPESTVEQHPAEIVKRLIVEIVNKPAVKRFVGGFFDTRKNVEFHHAITQTGPHESRINRTGIISRYVQTIKTRDYAHFTRESQYVQATQNTDLFGTSLSKPLTYIRPKHPVEDSIIKPNHLLHKVIVIQRNWRWFLFKRFMHQSAMEYRRLLAKQQANHIACANQELQLFVGECYKKTYPKSREDFNLLIVQIHKWKQAEIKRINELAWAGPKIALLHNVLNEEIRLLNEIEKRWFVQRKLNAEEKREQNLDDLGKPIQWMGYNNHLVEIDYLHTQKIRRLVSFYRMFKSKIESVPERLDIIEQTFELLKGEKPSKHTEALAEMLERERTLIGRSTLKCSDPIFKPMHMRQCDQLATIIELYGKAPNTKVHKEHIERLMCTKCHKVRPITEFEQSTRQHNVSVCLVCTMMKPPPKDMTIYRAILRQVQRNERRLGALPSFAFIARDQDIAALVETIWHSQSVLSQATTEEHGYELQLPRWRKGDDWSPWNCVCMTRQEARAHGLLRYPDRLYDEALVQRIEQKHELAKLMFAKMKQIDEDFVESKRWWRAGLNL